MDDFNELLRITEAENEARRAANLRANKNAATVTPADMLRAADLLDKAADAATPGPWKEDRNWVVISHGEIAEVPDACNAHLIALMGPDAARALALLLRDHAKYWYTPASIVADFTRRILEAQ